MTSPRRTMLVELVLELPPTGAPDWPADEVLRAGAVDELETLEFYAGIPVREARVRSITPA